MTAKITSSGLPAIGKILTANDLLSGEAVYLSSKLIWVARFCDAELILDVNSANARLAEIQAHDFSVVGAYLLQARRSNNHAVELLHFREVMRSNGPSNRRVEKQVALENPIANSGAANV